MQSMQISLPESLEQFIDNEVKAGGFGSASAYVQKVLQDEQRRQGVRQVDALLHEGLQSGAALPADEAFWQRKDRQLGERHGNAKNL